MRKNQELEQLREALLGIAENISDVLKAAPEAVDNQLSQMIERNKQHAQVLARLQTINVKGDTQVAFMQKMAKSLDETITALSGENQKLTAKARAEKLKGLKQDVEQVKTQIRRPGS